jgi:Fanconi anemia group M protein
LSVGRTASFVDIPEVDTSEAKSSLQIDLRERGSRLAELALNSDHFNVGFERLRLGDYIINQAVLVERKSSDDLAASIIDGRLFRQARAMARSPLRAVFLLEGPGESALLKLHPHSILGACISLAVTWRQPLLISRSPEESLLIFRFIAEQVQGLDVLELTRCGYRPKRSLRRKLFVLQGLPGVGPKLAASLLSHFASVEKVMAADASQLRQVRGCGPKKAAAIRQVLE